MADYIVNPWAGQDIGFGPGMTAPDLAAPAMFGSSQDPSITSQWANQDIGFGAGNTAPSGSGWGDASKWATGLKELAGGVKGAGLPSPGTPSRTGLPSAAGMHQGQAGGLGTLLQLLAQRALAFNQAAHQGAVPTQARGSGGLLGL